MRAERGGTLLELVLVAAVLGIVVMAVMTLYGQGLRIEALTRHQYQMQERGRWLLETLVEGAKTGTASPPGLREASQVATSPDGVAYRVGNLVVTYYLEGTRLKRSVGPFTGTLAVVPEGGETVLEYVVQFAVEEGDPLTVVLRLSAAVARESADVYLETKVSPRNRPK
ncbi:MAG: type II secretion system protein [Bacillota bacterium]